MRKETLGFPVPLGSLGLFGVLDGQRWEPASSVSHAGRRGGWKDLQPCQGGGEGRAGRVSWTSTIALRCTGAMRRHPGLETSWPPLLPLGPNLTFPALRWWHLSWDRLDAWCPTLRAPLRGFHCGACGGEVGGWKNVGNFVTKAGFQPCHFESSKDSRWRLRRDKSPKKKKKKNNSDHLEALHQGLEDLRGESSAPASLPIPVHHGPSSPGSAASWRKTQRCLLLPRTRHPPAFIPSPAVAL